MSNANFSHGMQSKMARTVGVMLVLTLLLSGGAPEAAAGLWVRRDWSRVQIVTPGTRTTVLLYKDRAPRGQRKIKGVFYSAQAESVTLLLPNGQTRTLLKQDVRKVLVRRPLKKRYQGWIAAGTGTALGVRGMLHPGNDFNPLGNLLLAVWRSDHGRDAPGLFPPELVVQVKALACELPATHGLPLSRWSVADLGMQVRQSGLVGGHRIRGLGR